MIYYEQMNDNKSEIILKYTEILIIVKIKINILKKLFECKMMEWLQYKSNNG